MSIPQSGGGPIEHFGQLAEYLADGCKPEADWRIGTEHEKFGYCKDTLNPLPYEGDRSIKAMLEGLRDRFGWSEIQEAGHIIGLEKDGANVSLEPGGQLELSGAPLESIHQTCDEVNVHLREVQDVADGIGAGFIGLGAAPIWTHEQMPMMPKGRYRLMTDYMGRVGTHGTQMMYRTCTVQVNLDFGSEADMVKKFRVALALQPVATALFACSPFFEGKPNGYQSWRGRIWQGLVYRDGVYIDALGMSFRDFLKGELPALPGEMPTLSDWADHLTTIFPEARIKKFMEMRGADGGPWRRICALPAFWVGLMYDASALDAAWDICKDWSEEERETLRVDAAKLGLKAEIKGRSLLEVASDVLAISKAGMEARAFTGADGLLPDETHFLNALHEIVDRGESPSDELLARYNGPSFGLDLVSQA